MAIAERDFMFGTEVTHLSRELRIPRPFAMGLVLYMWEGTQHKSICDATRQTLELLIEHKNPSIVFDAFLACGIVVSNGDETYHIPGNNKHISKLSQLRHNSSRGGTSRSMSGKREQNGRFVQPESSRSPADGPGVSSPASASASASASDTIRSYSESVFELPTPINERPQQDTRALMLGKKYLEARGRLGQKLTPQESADMQSIVEAAGDSADAALGRFLSDSRQFYQDTKWALKFLLRDLNEHLSPKSSNMNTENPAVAARRALGEEQRKQREENERNIPIDPDAESKLKKILSKLI